MRFSNASAPQPVLAAAQPSPASALLSKELLTEAQVAVLDLMRRAQEPLVLDGSAQGDAASSKAEQELRTAVAQVVGRRHEELPNQARLDLIDQLIDEMRGFGPLEPLLKQRDQFEEIEVNRWDRVFVIPKGGEAQLTDVKFRDDAHVRFICQRLLSSVRRRITEAEPMVDASLPGGMRINVVMAPIAVDGTVLTIRLHHAYQGGHDLVAVGTLTEEAMFSLMALVVGGGNILFTGGTGSGKTTLLNMVCNYIPMPARIVTVEDAAELQIRPGNVIRLETRPANIEGKGEITIRHLVRNALRMRPDWIIVGEMRGAEALDVLTAGNSGHAVYSTLHSNTARDGLHKLTTYAAMSDENLSEIALHQQVAAAFHAVVHLERQGPRRRVVQISEVTGVDPVTHQVLTEDIFKLIDGELTYTGVTPTRWIAALEQRGIPVPSLWWKEVTSDGEPDSPADCHSDAADGAGVVCLPVLAAEAAPA